MPNIIFVNGLTMKTRAKIIIKGKVQKVGFRSFVTDNMLSLGLAGHANNLPDGTVKVLCEGEESAVKKLLAEIKSNSPQFATVDSVEDVRQDYTGDLKKPQRKGNDVPESGATMDDLLKVMQSFDSKGEVMIKILSSTDQRLSNIEGKQDQMLDKQDQMLGNQDKTIEVIGGKIDNLAEKTDNVGRKIDNLAEKTDNVGRKIDNLAEKTDSFHEDMTQRFDTVDVKYGIMAEAVTGAALAIEKTNKTMEKNTEKILARMEKQQESQNKTTEKLIKVLIASQSKE